MTSGGVEVHESVEQSDRDHEGVRPRGRGLLAAFAARVRVIEWAH